MTTPGAAATSTPALLRIAEDELQELRRQLAAAVAFIHDPAYDLSARHALARLLQLPQPAARSPQPGCTDDRTPRDPLTAPCAGHGTHATHKEGPRT